MALRNVRVFVSILVIAVAAACGGGEAPSEPMGAEPTGPPATPLDPATAGNVTGMVVLEGTPPDPERIRMNADPVCVREAIETETEYYMVGDGGSLGNVFVYVKEGLEQPQLPDTERAVHIRSAGLPLQAARLRHAGRPDARNPEQRPDLAQYSRDPGSE